MFKRIQSCGLCIIQYIPRNMHTVFALLCFVVVIRWLIFPYPSGLLHWHCGNLTIAPVPAKQPWWIWINTSCEFIMNDCITTTKQSTTKPCAYFLGYTVRYPLEMHITTKSREISFIYIFFIYPIVSKFHTEHDSITILLWEISKRRTTTTDVMAEQDFVRFEFKTSFGQISCITKNCILSVQDIRVF